MSDIEQAIRWTYNTQIGFFGILSVNRELLKRIKKLSPRISINMRGKGLEIRILTCNIPYHIEYKLNINDGQYILLLNNGKIIVSDLLTAQSKQDNNNI